MRLLMVASPCLALAMASGVGIARAADPITVAEYVQLEQGMIKGDRDTTLVTYMSGVADALYASNVVLVAQRKPQLYCANQETPLSATQLMRATDHLLVQAARDGRTASEDLSIAVVAANAVSLAFRCN